MNLPGIVQRTFGLDKTRVNADTLNPLNVFAFQLPWNK